MNAGIKRNGIFEIVHMAKTNSIGYEPNIN